MSMATTFGLRLVGERLDLLADPLGVGEEDRGLPAARGAGRGRSRPRDAPPSAAGRRWFRACARGRRPAGSAAWYARATSDRMMAMRMPLSVPSSMTPRKRGQRPRELHPAHRGGWTGTPPAGSARSSRRRRRPRASPAASGRSAGASRNIVASVTPAVTSSATWVRAPAWRLTAVWDVPPPDGMAPRNAPRRVRDSRREQLPIGAAASARRCARRPGRRRSSR